MKRLMECVKKQDKELVKWKQEVVTYNDYQPFGMLFNRIIEWKEKRNLVKKRNND